MSAHPPPVPPEQRSGKAPAAGPGASKDAHTDEGFRPQDRNLAEQGRQGNIKQNTTNKGFQQDR